MTIAIIGIVFMIVLILLGMNIGMSMVLVGFVGYGIVTGNWTAALGILKSIPYSTGMTYSFVVCPMFILMGQLIYHSGLSTALFNAAEKWFAGLRGGLAMATVVACALFGAICGSLAATAATMAVVAIPEMRKAKYQDSLASGCVAAGGTLGVLIPPSTTFIMYGIIAELSIGRLFASGVGPGILLTICFCITIAIQTKLNPELAPKTETYPLDVKLRSLIGCIPMVILFYLVIGGMFSGYFSATEASGVGVFLSLAYMIAIKKFTLQRMWIALKETVKTTSMVLFITVGAYVFGSFLAITQLPIKLADTVAAMDANRYAIILVIFLVYAVMGCIMDALPMVLLTAPIFLPIIKELGFDPVWYGAMMVLIMNLGNITPPVGLTVYIVGGVNKDIPLPTIFKVALPMCIALLVCVVICIIFPQIVTFLPDMLYN